MSRYRLGEFLAYYDELVRTWSRRLRNRHEAEDVAQDTVLRLLEVDGARIMQPRAYLHRAARNLATDARRRRATHEVVPVEALDDVAATDGDPYAALQAARMVSALEAALAELPLKCRQAFIWHRLDGLPQAHIAERLGVSKNMVEKHMIRALRHLRDRVGPLESD